MNTHNTRLLLGALLILSTGLLCGCPTTGVYRTAKTLEPGVSDIGLSFSAVRIQSSEVRVKDAQGNTVTDSDQSEISGVLPKLIPEISFHVGVIEDLELGGRVDLLAGYLEVDGKYRFLRAAEDKFHLAVQPAIGYQTAFILEGTRLSLPVIATYELNDTFAFNAYGIGQYATLSSTITSDDATDDGDNSPIAGYSGITVGGGGGVMISGETFYFMPGVEYTTLLSNIETSESGAETELNSNFLTISLTMGWKLGQEAKRQKKMDRKLDKIDNKLDKLDNKLDRIPATR